MELWVSPEGEGLLCPGTKHCLGRGLPGAPSRWLGELSSLRGVPGALEGGKAREEGQVLPVCPPCAHRNPRTRFRILVLPPAVWPQASCLTSLSLVCLVCKWACSLPLQVTSVDWREPLASWQASALWQEGSWLWGKSLIRESTRVSPQHCPTSSGSAPLHLTGRGQQLAQVTPAWSLDRRWWSGGCLDRIGVLGRGSRWKWLLESGQWCAFLSHRPP